ncbi:MAG: hypothetical protein KJ955_06035 [Nanoarchaeota archaeon]|nr:hypothetical protein [Nanoarchaeota archaeon]
MADRVIPVKERLKRLQQQNYKSLPERQPEEKTVEEELEEFKNQALIKPVSDAETAKKEELNKVIVEADGEPTDEELFKQEEKETIYKVEQKIIEIETIKKEMMANGNFMKRLYEIKQAEKKLLPILYDAKIKGMELSEELKARIAVAAPKAALLD